MTKTGPDPLHPTTRIEPLVVVITFAVIEDVLAPSRLTRASSAASPSKTVPIRQLASALRRAMYAAVHREATRMSVIQTAAAHTPLPASQVQDQKHQYRYRSSSKRSHRPLFSYAISGYTPGARELRCVIERPLWRKIVRQAGSLITPSHECGRR